MKYVESRPDVMSVRCCSHSLTNGKVRHTKRYTQATIDWLAVYDRITDRCYYIPATLLGESGMFRMHLRLTPTRNGQRLGVRYAEDFLDPKLPVQSALEVEPAGLEPATSRMQTGRSPN